MLARFLFACGLALGASSLLSLQAVAHDPGCNANLKFNVQEDLDQIAKSRSDFTAYYAEGDVTGIVGAYDDNATFAGTLQPYWLEGKAEVESLWSRFFAAWPSRTLIFRQPTVCFHDEKSSTETGHIEMYMGNATNPMVITFIRYSITRVKTVDGWKIVNMHAARMPGN